ncbi:hypothetical protein AB1Y20_003353 [Prymnesium parvum]|uniref:Uncharacterized protein n=1 Tax=Prymnesium parvum TaxID=97485 RepID=A0AB34JBY1_PRYPA
MGTFLKLAYFAVERAAEPLSERLEAAAARSESFRRACTRLANWANGIEYRKQQRRLARGRERCGLPAEEVAAPQLSVEAATEAGCQLIGEGFVIAVGLALLMHQELMERAAEEAQQKDIEHNQALLNEMRVRLLELESTQSSLIVRAVQSERRANELQGKLEQLRQQQRWSLHSLFSTALGRSITDESAMS